MWTTNWWVAISKAHVGGHNRDQYINLVILHAANAKYGWDNHMKERVVNGPSRVVLLNLDRLVTITDQSVRAPGDVTVEGLPQILCLLFNFSFVNW